jgi:hypothetical protein
MPSSSGTPKWQSRRARHTQRRNNPNVVDKSDVNEFPYPSSRRTALLGEPVVSPLAFNYPRLSTFAWLNNRDNELPSHDEEGRLPTPQVESLDAQKMSELMERLGVVSSWNSVYDANESNNYQSYSSIFNNKLKLINPLGNTCAIEDSDSGSSIEEDAERDHYTFNEIDPHQIETIRSRILSFDFGVPPQRAIDIKKLILEEYQNLLSQHNTQETTSNILSQNAREISHEPRFHDIINSRRGNWENEDGTENIARLFGDGRRIREFSEDEYLTGDQHSIWPIPNRPPTLVGEREEREEWSE